MPRLGKVALPGDDVVWTAAVSMSNQNAAYPATNIKTADPALVAKSTTTSTAITINCGSNVTPVAIALINTNATTAVITNAAGLNQAITIPAVQLDGQRVHGWKSLVGLANVTDDIFTVTISVPSGVVWIGRIALVLAVQTVNWAYGPTFGVSRPGNTIIQTRLGSVMVHDAGIRTRFAEFTFTLDEDMAMWRALEQSAKGPVLPFLFIPFADTNDSWWVRLPDGFKAQFVEPGYTDVPLRFEELSSGPPNG